MTSPHRFNPVFLVPRRVLSWLLSLVRRTVSLFRLVLLIPLGLRAHHTCILGKGVSVDGGGSGGRVFIGQNTVLDIGAILRADGGLIRIGSNCSVNPYCVLIGSQQGLIIGNGVRIAAHTVIVATNHVFDDVSKFIYQQGNTSKGITIEDDVWVGAGAKILDGVTIGKGTVVAAGAVVTKSTENYSVVAGVPARKISSRNSRTVGPSSNGVAWRESE